MNRIIYRRALFLALVTALVTQLACGLTDLAEDILRNMEATRTASGGYDWYVSTDGDDTYACNTLIRACKTLEGAIEKASAGDSIYIAAGTYTEPRTPGGRVDINLNLTLQGAGVDQTVLDFTGSVNGIYIGGEAEVFMNDLTVQNVERSGTAPYNGDCISVGRPARRLALLNVAVQNCGTNGVSINDSTAAIQVSMQNVVLSENGHYGIYQYWGSLLIENSTIKLNTLSGIFTYDVSLTSMNTMVEGNLNHGIELWGGTANMDGVTIVNNGGGPSGAFLRGGTGLSAARSGLEISDSDRGANVTVTNSHFSGNVDGVRLGGRDSNLRMINTTIKDNHRIGFKLTAGNAQLDDMTIQHNGTAAETLVGEQAGGVTVEKGTLTLTGSRVMDNYGGIYVWGRTDGVGGNTLIYYTTIGNNSGDVIGGIVNLGSTSIFHSTITANTNELGYGGVQADGIYNKGSMQIVNSTVSNNHGVGIVGADRDNASLKLQFVTVAENEGDGIAVYGSFPVSVENSIVVLNGSDDCNFDEVADIAESATSMDTDGTCGGLTTSPDLLRLGPLADNGGLTQTHALLEGSPAIDAAAGSPPSRDDQRGTLRPVGAASDLGAYEYGQAVAAIPDSAQVVTTPTLTPSPTLTPQLPTITRDTLCLEGPGPAYKVISSIPTGTVVELLGIGAAKGWYVIENPTYHSPCWVPEGNISVPPNTDLKIIPVPPAPTSTPVLLIPKAPTKISANTTACSANGYVVKITWKDNSTNETGYRVYRDGQVIAQLGPNATSYVDNPPYSGPHTYVVEAFNNAGSSASKGGMDDGCVY